MKKLIIEISYTNHRGLLNALTTLRRKEINPGEFRSINETYAAVGYLYDHEEPNVKLIDGKIHHIYKSKM